MSNRRLYFPLSIQNHFETKEPPRIRILNHKSDSDFLTGKAFFSFQEILNIRKTRGWWSAPLTIL